MARRVDLGKIIPEKGVDYYTEAEKNQIEDEITDRLVGLYKRYESTYTTISADEDIIPIEIEQYDENCILEVYIEGRILNQDEYEVNENSTITLTNALSEIGTVVQFVVYKFAQVDSQHYDVLKGPKGDSGAIVFNTVAEMKADTDLQAGDTCQTLGYYSANDGGAGLYKIVDDDLLVDNGGSIHILDNGLKAELIIKEDKIYLEQFGSVGNGVFDNFLCFQKALNYIKDNNQVKKILLMKDKEYYVSNTLVVFDNTEINLNNSIISFESSHGFHNFRSTKFGWDINDEATEYNGFGFIHIYNGTIRYGSISFIHSHDVKFNNIKFINCKRNHFVEINACKNFIIEDCLFSGIISETNKEVIQIDECSYDGFPWFDNTQSITYDGTMNSHITINRCKFRPGDESDYAYLHAAIGSHGATQNSTHDHIIVSNCSFLNASENFIRPYSWRNSIIENNVFDSCNSYYIRFYGYNISNIVNNNKFLGNNTGTIIIASVDTEAYANNGLKDLCISNNIINVNNHTGVAFNAKCIDTLNISNNVANRDMLVTLGGNKNVTISNNICSSKTSAGYMHNGFAFENEEQTYGITTFAYSDILIPNSFTKDTTDTTKYTLQRDLADFNRITIITGGVSIGRYLEKEYTCYFTRKFQVSDKFVFDFYDEGSGEYKQGMITIDANNTKIIYVTIPSGSSINLRNIFNRKM